LAVAQRYDRARALPRSKIFRRCFPEQNVPDSLPTRDGVPVVHPLTDFAIVDLRPGEAVILNCALENDERPANNGWVKVKYIISKDFVERYGT
jgi:hypothetical protein